MRTFKYTLTIVALIGVLLLSVGTSAQARPAGKGAGNDHAYSARKIDKGQSLKKPWFRIGSGNAAPIQVKTTTR